MHYHLFLKKEERYPKALIPSNRFKDKIDLSLVKSNILLVRRSDKPYNEIFDELGLLREDAFHEKEVLDMSLNLLGGKFRIKDIKFNPKNEAAKRWTGQKSSIYKIYKFIEILPSSMPIFFWYSSINDKTFPYRKPKNQVQESLIKHLDIDLSKQGKNTLIDVEARTFVAHDPTLANYWHIEVRFNDKDNIQIPRKSVQSAWGKDLAKAALREVICVAGFSDISLASGYQIAKDEYLKV
ncbi:hypothetical protein DYU11_04070 [Fibrisoma montanum]|uniref:Uncharacterized protein n=1 Tax=Fibrisoma montanum TaxID=2305895 RepID=A0A418MJ98_9BACT|nr:hypothetical protein DYU11_04070 [Fibrisoma montanum]